MKVTSASSIIFIIVCMTTAYACIRINDDTSEERSIRGLGDSVRKNAQQRQIQATEAVVETAEDVAEVAPDGQSPAKPTINLETISVEDEISILDAEELIEEITEDGNVTKDEEEDIDIDIFIPPRRKRCKASAITPLDSEQKATLEKHKKKIKIIEKNHKVLKKIKAKRGVVKLTKRQRIEVKAYLSGAFMKAESLPDIEGGALGNSSSDSLSRRKRFGNNTHRVCEPVYSWNNVYLTVNSNGTLVQVIQLGEDDTYQWFMEETCQSQISNIVNADCDEAERLHLAYVINLTTGDIEQTYVVVYCCVGLSVL